MWSKRTLRRMVILPLKTWRTAGMTQQLPGRAAEAPRELEFQAGENDFDDELSKFTAVRLHQAVREAKEILTQPATLRGGMAVMTSPSKALTTPKGGLDTLCDRRQMEEAYADKYGCPKPRLDQQGSDAYLKLQFRYVAKGEIGHLTPSRSSPPFLRMANGL